MKLALILVAFVAVAGLAYIRTASSDPARWHIDPTQAADPGRSGIRVAPGTITSDLSPAALLTRLNALLNAQPRTTVLSGSPDTGRITYVIRSKWFGFPDYLTVQSIPQSQGGSTLAVVSRLRFGHSDFGVNAARLERFLAELDLSHPWGRAALGQQ